MNEETQLLQAIWRKAARAPVDAPLAIPCANAKQAARLRFRLYNAVRAVRAGQQAADEALIQAVADYSVSVGPHPLGEAPAAVIIQRKVSFELATTLLGILGSDEAEAAPLLKSPEQMEAEASQARLRQLLDGSGAASARPADDLADADLPPLPRHTPYYDR